MKILATIAARGGSKGLKNKNIKDLLGKPLIAYTIEQVNKWGRYDKFIVSTDSKEIANIAIRFGAMVPFMRPVELANDTSGKLDVLRHSLVKSERHYRTRFDVLLDLDATAPIRTIEDIENIVKLFEEANADCVFSVVKARRSPYFNMVEEKEDGTITICKKLTDEIVRRQDAPIVYEMNASMYVYRRDFLLDINNKLPYSGKSMVYKMGELSCVDIDSELDFKFIEFLIREGIWPKESQ